LNLEGNPAATRAALRLKGRVVRPDMGSESTLMSLNPEANVSGLGAQLLARYDRNKDGKLARSEIGFDRGLFDELDANKDGFLDAMELQAFFAREPDLVFRIRVGQLSRVSSFLTTIGIGTSMPDRLEVFNPSKRAMPLTKGIRKINGENLAFALGDTRFQLQAQDNNVQRFDGVKNFYLQQFDAIADKKGYVDRAQEKENQQQPFLFYLFTQADKDADGKLTRKELSDWLDLLQSGSNAFVSLQVTDQGRSLFSVMDADGNSQLSLRELRSAWTRMKPLCKDGKSFVLGDLPRTMQIAVGQGGAFFRGGVPVAFTYETTMARPVVSPGAVPMWFRKMDRNGDGDISPREWLGTEEEFRQIDTDGDGLISAEEAKAYEAKKKARK